METNHFNHSRSLMAFGRTGMSALHAALHAQRWVAAVVMGALCVAAPLAARGGSPPVVSNVSAHQRAGTTGSGSLVDISYDLADPDSPTVSISIEVSKDSGTTWTVPANTFTGAWGANVTPGAGKAIVWSAGADWDGQYTAMCKVRVIANDDGYALIPAGNYLRGNPPALGDSDITDAPQYSVYISAFYMDPYLVTGSLWDSVKTYALAHSYSFENPGDDSKGAGYPVQTIDWLDAVKWCNARSEMLGLTPAYYTDGTYGTVLRTGAAGSTTPAVKLTANGYRLPTEAEWEKAARGGATGHRFPWSDTDHISESRANYFSASSYTFDDSNTGYNPTYGTGGQPYTSPVGSFAANSYGLYDMAGNVLEWCGDWYGQSYYTSGQTNPQGPSSGGDRVWRGGSWGLDANLARCANRGNSSPAFAGGNFGFRCVRGL